MEHDIRSGLLTRNHLKHLTEADQLRPPGYLEAVKALARLTYESIYVIDYQNMAFEYVSENPLFLCGCTPAEVQELGYEFYFRYVPHKDLEMLHEINEAGFSFFEKLPLEDRMGYSITYDFHLTGSEGKKVLINHRLTPLVLTGSGRIWKALCIVSLSGNKDAGNILIARHDSDELWELYRTDRVWRRQSKPKLTPREMNVLRMHAQGLTISEIADKICVSPDTVKYYRRKIFAGMGVNNMTEALSYTVRYKII